MATYDEPSSDFKAISNGAKKSPAFRKMAGTSDEPDGDEASASGETSDFRDAYAAAQAKDEDAFVASILAGVKACIANYGSKK